MSPSRRKMSDPSVQWLKNSGNLLTSKFVILFVSFFYYPFSFLIHRLFIFRANAPIFGIDTDGNVNEWNDKTAEITGFKADEALGKPLVSTFIVPKLQATVQGILVNALKGKETSNYELEFTTKGNEIRYLLGKNIFRCRFNL